MQLRRQQNYRKILLGEHTTGESVAVRRKDGTFAFLTWRGFIDRGQARHAPGAIPVKLAIEAFTVEEDLPAPEWVQVPTGWYVQGSLTADGVRCVLFRGCPRLVRASSATSNSEL